jgi:1-acyl-sn-glycerol-3-phosphate acyltransferase
LSRTVPHPTERPPWAWRLAVRVVLTLLRGVMGWRVRARRPDPIPPSGKPLVVVFNHTSAIDAFLIADTLWRGLRHWVQPLVKAELFDVPVIGAIAHRAGAIPVLRTKGTGRDAAYDAAVARLQEGGTILIAPEGTTTHDGSLLPFRHGAARLALEAGVDVLAVTHLGAQRAFSPVVRFPERRVIVTMAMDVITPWPDDDASSLTARIAATMIDRSKELLSSYPQADPDARWWPPYARPASPTAVARENLERYRQSMAEAVEHARERMRQVAEEHAIEQRLAEARDRAVSAAEELAARSRARAGEVAEHTRERVEELAEQARERVEELAEHTRERVEELADQTRARAEGTGRRDAAPHEPSGRAGGSTDAADTRDEDEEPSVT